MIKMKRKEVIAQLKEIVSASKVENMEEVLAFLDKENALLEKKRNTPTKAQKENLVYVEMIYEVLTAADKAMSIEDIQNASDNEEIKAFSTSKMSALLKKLVDANRVERTKVNKKSYFVIVQE
jgi:hypothetical protein